MFDKLLKLLYPANNRWFKEKFTMEQDPEDIPTLKTEGTIFRIVELKVKLKSLATESQHIRLEENKLKRSYRRSQSKIIQKYLEPDETFVDDTLPKPEYYINQESYDNVRMRRRYQRAKEIAKEKHPEFFSEEKHEKYDFARQLLAVHRTFDVGRESRAAYIAYGFIRGKRYSQVEMNPRWKYPPHDRYEPDWEHIKDIVSRFALVPGKSEVVKKKLLDEIKIWKGN
jgi:hypothetical protein